MPGTHTSQALTTEIVDATRIDIPEAVALANAAFSVHPLVLAPRTSVKTFRDEYPDGARFLSIRRDGRLVGMAMVAEASIELFGFTQDGEQSARAAGVPTRGDLYFGIASVDPGEQGAGVGRRLLGSAEALARADGFRRVVLTTVRELGNVPYYERAGYTVVASEWFAPGHYSIPVRHESCLMVKAL